MTTQLIACPCGAWHSLVVGCPFLDDDPTQLATTPAVSPPDPPHPHESSRAEPSPTEVELAQPCGAYADHVDHLLPRSAAVGQSALTPTGSTRRWRRIRAWVLNRDGWRCQVLVDSDGRVVESPRPARPPAGPDDPDWLRATCPAHNLQRGKSLTDAGPRNRTTTPRWSW